VTFTIETDTPVGAVLGALHDRIDPNSPPMLVGAEARDLLHSELGHSFANRATRDVDLAFVIPRWEAYDEIVRGLVAIPYSGIAFRVAGHHVDFLAFGPIEAPSGTVRPPFRPSDPLDVFGMTAVYADSRSAVVRGGPHFRLPTVAGYTALKLKAWVDRSANHNEKDAPDIGLILFWASESAVFSERFWSDFDLVDATGADAALGAPGFSDET
jgi:predicted nucleotidyltransferase